jgi:sugar phosphate isomerase/epimerase
MQLGIFAKTFPGTTPGAVLAQVKQAGFAVAQYNLACSGLAAMPDAVPASACEAVRLASAATGIHVNALSATYNMIHPNRAVRDEGHRRLAVVAAAAKAMHIPLLTLCTGTCDAEDQWRHHPDNATPEAWADLLASMQAAITIAEAHDLTLGIEPELANVVNSARKAASLINTLQSPRLKIVLDAANLFEVEPLEHQRRIVSEAVDLLADHIIMAHAKDRTADGSFTVPGEGVLDYGHFIRELTNVGFNGPLVTHGLTAEQAPAVAACLQHHLSSR